MVQLLSGVIKGKVFWRGSHYNGPAQGGCRGGLVHHYVCHRLCLLVGHVSLSYPSDQMSQWSEVFKIFLVGYHQALALALGPLYSWPSPVCIIIIITTITEIWKNQIKY